MLIKTKDVGVKTRAELIIKLYTERALKGNK